MIDARKDAKFHILQTYDNEPLADDEFLNCEFYVDSQKRGDFERNNKPIISAIAMATHKSEQQTDIHVRDHPVELPEFKGTVWISVSKLKGRLGQDAIITTI